MIIFLAFHSSALFEITSERLGASTGLIRTLPQLLFGVAARIDAERNTAPRQFAVAFNYLYLPSEGIPGPFSPNN